jgi:hypothetical protein
MASTYKVLGQANPANTATATLYTVPAGGQAIVSTITVANVTSSPASFDIYIGVDGAVASTANALAFGVTLLASQTQALTLGVTADATDVIYVKTSVADALTFSAFGLEIS